MGKCFNRSLPEYKALEEEYGHFLIVDGIIDKFQRSTKNDMMPTVQEAKDLVTDIDVAYSLKKQQFGNALLANLVREKIIANKKGVYYVQHSNPLTRMHEPAVLRHNLNRLKSYIKHNKLNGDIISLLKLQTKPTYRVNLNIDLLTKRDLIVNNNKESLTYINQLVDHLTSVIPGVTVKILSVREAEELHSSIGGTVDFRKVNSFYHNGTAVLIKGRVTAETAIEEVLHPFVSALKEGNATLYNSLKEEGLESFPELIQHIKDKYTDDQGFSKADREMEFVTQALSKHFLHEFKNNPTQGWATKIKEFLKWFRDLVDSYLIKNSGRSLSLNPNKLNKMSLSEVANLLNTSNLSFDITLKETDRVQYSLSSETQKMVDVAKGQGNSVQRMVIDNLFHNIEGFKEKETDNLSTSLVILKRDTHTYVNLDGGEIYNSTTERIGGKFDDQGKYELNRQLGNDFDHILNSIVEGRSFDSIKDDMIVADIDQAKSAYEMLEIYTDGLRADGSILLAQVVVSDDVTSTGGTIDMLRVHPNGSLTIIDLKTSGHHYLSDSYKNFPHPVSEGSIWYDPIKKPGETDEEHKLRQFRLTTKMKHSLQTNSYARMLSNQGFEVNDASQTYHVLVDINKEDGVMTSFKLQGITNHKLSDNISLVDELISEEVNTGNNENVKEKYNKEHNVVESDGFLSASELHAEDESISMDLYDALFKALEGFNISLVNREAILKRAKGYLSSEYTRKEAMREIIDARTILNIALKEGRASAAYTDFLKYSIKEVKEFKDYAINPDNQGTREYLNKILNWRKMSNSYKGLVHLDYSKGLSHAQLVLKEELMDELNLLEGIKNPDGTVREVGVFDVAIEDYIKAMIKETSNRQDLTEETLNELMRKAKDIGIMESRADGLATSSDTILAVMDKIFKREKQRMLDEVGYKLSQINTQINKLEKLTGSTTVDYTFMNEYGLDGKYTGNYTKETGRVYYDKLDELTKKLYDTNGNYISYIEIDNIADATEKELDKNKEIYKNRQARMEFMRAEERTDTGPIDGEYHRFTEEFKTARAKHEIYHNTHLGGYWVRKEGVNDRDYTSYETKYYDTVNYDKAIRDENNEFTGVTTKGTGLKVVRKDYTEKRKVARDGTNLVNEKYTKIMTDTSELGRAQREFYLLFVDMYENDLLEKLPETLHRIGKAPTIAASISEEMTNKPNIIAHMWAKTIGAMRNLPSATKNVFTRSVKVQRVNIDEYGNLSENNLPLFFVSNALNEKDLTELEEALALNLAKFKAAKSEAVREKYKKEVSIIKNEIFQLERRPLKEDVSQDMGESLRMMVGMTENYHVLNQLEDTYKAFIEVLEKRKYHHEGEDFANRGFNYAADIAAKGTTWAAENVKKVAGRKGTSVTKSEAETIRRARKWMSMVFYDNDHLNDGAFAKITKGIISLSSATYVAFNVFGNLNNYVMARVNNAIEGNGERFFSRNAHLRSIGVYNTDVMRGVFTSIADVREGSIKRNMPTKALAMIDQIGFMDVKADMREQGRSEDGQEPFWRKLIGWGYILQDAGEFNLQTKVGLSIMMSSRAINSVTGEDVALYDAYKYNAETGVLEVKEGFDKAQIYGKPEVKDLNKDFQYEIRNYIRETNKEIHGNYAHEDRMAIQSHALGQLAAQFHKWVIPAVKARFRGEYFDENLGYMEGRYITAVKFVSHSARTVRSIEDFMNMGSNFAEYKNAGREGTKFEGQNVGKNSMFNIKRTMAELLLVNLTFYLKALLLQMWDDDDDKGELRKKFENIALYQLDRLYKEQVLFIPLFADSYEQVGEMMKSPIAGTRTLGEYGKAVSMTAWGLYEHPKPWYTSYEDEMKEYKKNKDYFYQRNPHRGDSKVRAQWGRTLPAYYSWKKWDTFDIRKNFYIGG